MFVPSPAAVPGRPTLLISHGGGFLWRTGCEGPNVAWFFHRMGYNTAILSYRLRPYSRMAALADIQRAVRLLRAEKDRFGIGDAVVTMGFSAGGMLSGNCATHFDNGCLEAEDPVERFSCRPDACVVGYGAMSGVSFPAPLVLRRIRCLGKERSGSIWRRKSMCRPPARPFSSGRPSAMTDATGFVWQKHCRMPAFPMSCTSSRGRAWSGHGRRTKRSGAAGSTYYPLG